ncbi:Ppx/GppA family phosphatase [Sphingomonas sp. LHG3406-1]|uniref:Ppx/GppA family phosphatase n=1 Tax=Sphingomonas sp. LHG3406-1 TaxID=2804617 RepID=UPI002610F0FE|nr:Ppx/GppA family phosphatase [Sphingomonas sp. LHG3406-1]
MKRGSFGPVGIIDIGSNSIRFVAYAGTERVPSTLFNEKVSAGLGRELASTGRLPDKAMDQALAALARFRLLAREMKLKRLDVVATAAVRDADNGDEFLARARKAGIEPSVISGEEEARLAALGVISAIPTARGVVADLGGGSLELTPVADGKPGPGISLPLGVLRVGPDASAKQIATILKKSVPPAILAAAAERTLYLVGGSFRAFVQLDQQSSDYPLHIVHGHALDAIRAREVRQLVRGTEPEQLKSRFGLSTTRSQTLGAAAAVLEALFRVLEPARAVASAYGLREGLLYDHLAADRRAEDPLLVAALEAGEKLGRFGDHGAELDAWIAPIFPDDDPSASRLRLAACLLADVAWEAHPDFRALWAVDMGVHGNWVGIDALGRTIIGRTLWAAFGGDGPFNPALAQLVEQRVLDHAGRWGAAIRLAQRLSGGTERLLSRCSIALEEGEVVLRLKAKDRALYSDIAARRHRQLASLMGCGARLEVG